MSSLRRTKTLDRGYHAPGVNDSTHNSTRHLVEEDDGLDPSSDEDDDLEPTPEELEEFKKRHEELIEADPEDPPPLPEPVEVDTNTKPKAVVVTGDNPEYSDNKDRYEYIGKDGNGQLQYLDYGPNGKAPSS